MTHLWLEAGTLGWSEEGHMSMRQMLATSNGGQACELGVEKNIGKLWTLEPNSQVMSLKFVFFKAHDPITFSSRFGTLLPNQIQLTTYR